VVVPEDEELGSLLISEFHDLSMQGTSGCRGPGLQLVACFGGSLYVTIVLG
jgi:hypothetical protein